MGTMYWITVLGNIYTLSVWALIILTVVTTFLGVCALVKATDAYADEEDKRVASKYYKMTKKLALCSYTSLCPFIRKTLCDLWCRYSVGLCERKQGSSKAARQCS